MKAPTCWRCSGPVVLGAPSCARCGAPLRRAADRAGERRGSRVDKALGAVLVLFVIQLLTSIVFGAVVSFGMNADTRSKADPAAPLHAMAFFEAIDSVVIVVGVILIARPRKYEPMMRPAIAWALGVPAILGALAANQAYHAVMRSLVHARSEPDLALSAGVSPLVFLTFCVQPGIIEELFFRHLALDSLRGVMSPKAAVFVSSMMFGLAHLGVPLSIPVLALVGAVLGWARIASGSIVLPMLLHALHNFVIVLLN